MIEIQQKGLTEATLATAKLSRDLKGGYARFFEGTLSGKLTTYFVDRFDSEGGKYGEHWAPLTARTLAQTRTVRRGGILYRFGTLRQSFVSPGAPGSVESVKPFEYVRGSRVRYAIFHQVGTHRMPARPILAVPPALAQFWLSLLSQYVDTRARDAGLEPT